MIKWFQCALSVDNGSFSNQTPRLQDFNWLLIIRFSTWYTASSSTFTVVSLVSMLFLPLKIVPCTFFESDSKSVSLKNSNPGGDISSQSILYKTTDAYAYFISCQMPGKYISVCLTSTNKFNASKFLISTVYVSLI